MYIDVIRGSIILANLRWILAVAVGVIAGLVTYGLAGTYAMAWAVCIGTIAFFGIVLASHFAMRPDDRDPTIRPSNVPKKR